MTTSQIVVPRTDGQSPTVLQIGTGSVVFLLGQNGTGKSALMHNIKMSLGSRAVYMPGARPSYFEAEGLSLTPASRRTLGANLAGWDNMPDTRWRAISGTARNEKAVHDLQNAELRYISDATNDIKLHGKHALAIERLRSKLSPLDKINVLLEQANLPVRLALVDGELRAARGDAVYSFAKMSDGERTSLVFAAEVASASPDSVFVVDEPELHLHRSIVVPLLKSLIQSRQDCSFIISTHELALPGEIAEASAILIRGCRWQNDFVSEWDISVVSDLVSLPEELRVDVLGSRKIILFVEGVGSGRSLDYPLYALLFPNISVREKGDCKEVYRAVSGVRGTENHHRALAYGLVDQDGMESAQSLLLQEAGVFALPMFAVESIYYSKAVLEAVSEKQASNLGVDGSILLQRAKQEALASIQEHHLTHLASRVAERKVRDQLQFEIPNRQHMIEGTSDKIEIRMASPYPSELAKIRGFFRGNDLESIIQLYPARESGIFTAISTGLRFLNRADYEKAALARIGASEDLRQALRNSLGEVSKLLN